MLTVLANYNVTVDELKAIFNKLKGVDHKWTKNSVKLLNVLKAMPHRYGPDEFFSLPGRKSSVGASALFPPFARSLALSLSLGA